MSYGVIIGVGAATWLFYQWILFLKTKSKVKDIPTVGADGFITSYISGWKFFFKGHEMLQEGYDKYPGTAFKIPTLSTANRWMIVLNGPQMIEDVRKAHEEELSFREAGFELIHSKYLWGGAEGSSNPYQIEVIRGPMARGYPSRFADIKDEIHHAFAELLPVTDEWKAFKPHTNIIPIICRTTNRLFVGTPLCRDEDYCRIQQNLTIHSFMAARFLDILPQFLRPLVGRLVTTFPSSSKRLQDLLRPLVQERIQMDDLYGLKWEGRPNDLISWLLDLAPPERRNLEDLTLRITLINFASIHSTAITATNVLFDLACRQEYIAPLREELEAVIKQHGWTKNAMNHLHKLDSFMKESGRLSGLGAMTLNRKAKKDYTLSNGVVIPAGFRLFVTSQGTQLDECNYDDPLEFKGYRFFQKRDAAGGADHLRHQMISLDPTYLVFGHGRAACPGRFFVVNEIKLILAFVLLNFDIKMPHGENKPPAPVWFGGARSPSQSAEILFRKRQT